MNKFLIERIKYPEQPNRCQGITKWGQCTIVAVQGCKSCYFHGGKIQESANEKAQLFQYRLERYQHRIDSFQSSNALKSLREEIALTRFLTQKLLDFGHDNLLLYSTPICRLMEQVSNLSLASAKIEHNLESVIEFDNAVEIAHNVCNQIPEGCEKFSIIGEEILDLLDKSRNLHISSSEANNELTYSFPTWGTSITSFISKEKIVSIRSEIAVLRMILEEQINKCHDAQSLIYNLATISELVKKIMEFVLSCHKLESSMGLMLSRTESVVFGQEIIRILSSHLTDEELKRINL